MTPNEELDHLYIQVGEKYPNVDDSVFDRIYVLEAIVNPPVCREVLNEQDRSEILCHPSCHGDGCWDCAAIRGGCPEDA